MTQSPVHPRLDRPSRTATRLRARPAVALLTVLLIGCTGPSGPGPEPADRSLQASGPWSRAADLLARRAGEATAAGRHADAQWLLANAAALDARWQPAEFALRRRLAEDALTEAGSHVEQRELAKARRAAHRARRLAPDATVAERAAVLLEEIDAIEIDALRPAIFAALNAGDRAEARRLLERLQRLAPEETTTRLLASLRSERRAAPP